MTIPETTTDQAPKKYLYWATMPFMNYVFSKGKLANFRHHRFATDIPEEIEQLNAEIKSNNPYIYTKSDALFLTDEMEDPMKALKAKIIADYLVEQAKHVNPSNDMGISDSGPIKPMSTTDIAATAAGGDGSQSAAKLVALTGQMAQAVPITKK